MKKLGRIRLNEEVRKDKACWRSWKDEATWRSWEG